MGYEHLKNFNNNYNNNNKKNTINFKQKITSKFL